MDTTVRQCLARYLHYLRAIQCVAAAKTYGNHLRVWLRWLDEAGLTTPAGARINGDSTMREVNSLEVIAASYAYFKARRTKAGVLLNNNTVRSFQHSIRALWKFACDRQAWHPDPAPLSHDVALTVPMVRRADNHREEATLDHAQALLDACELRPTPRSCALYYAVLQVLLTAGLRRQEMICLEVSDYDPSRKTLHVHRGKGGNPRTQRLDAETCQALDRWMTLRGTYIRGRWEQLPNGAWHHVADENAPDFLFTLSIRRHLSNAGVTTMFRELRKAAGLRRVNEDGTVERDLAITPHTLRHLQATRVYLASGLRAAQKYCGHKSERTTWAYIRSTTDEEMDSVLSEIQLRPQRGRSANEAIKPVKKKEVASAGSRRVDLRRRSA